METYDDPHVQCGAGALGKAGFSNGVSKAWWHREAGGPIDKGVLST